MPNVFLALARRPDEFRAFFAYHDALMDKNGGLSKAEREMIVVATSALNDCLYCVVAHGAILRIRAKNPRLADQVAVNHRKAEITPRQRAMLDFALKVATRSAEIDEADYARWREHGFSDEDAWDIAAIAAMFAMSNRLANALRHASQRRVLRDGALSYLLRTVSACSIADGGDAEQAGERLVEFQDQEAARCRPRKRRSARRSPPCR